MTEGGKGPGKMITCNSVRIRRAPLQIYIRSWALVGSFQMPRWCFCVFKLTCSVWEQPICNRYWNSVWKTKWVSTRRTATITEIAVWPRSPSHTVTDVEFVICLSLSRSVQSCNWNFEMFHRFRGFSRRQGRISEGMLKRSVVGTIFYQSTFSCLVFLSASHTTSSLLIQINSPKRNNNVFTSVI